MNLWDFAYRELDQIVKVKDGWRAYQNGEIVGEGKTPLTATVRAKKHILPESRFPITDAQ